MFDRVFSHQLMLADKVRMNSYKRAIFEMVKKGDIVCDIGTGSGILAFFAVLAGAKKVYAIEKDYVIEEAKELARLNGLKKKIVFINDRSDKVELPEKVDVIISELLGHFGLEENIYRFKSDARRRFLTSKGKLIPSWLDLYLVPVESSALWRDRIGIWDKDLYGLDFSSVKQYAVSNRYIADCSGKISFLANPFLISHVNFYEDERTPSILKGEFIINRKGVFHGLVGYFKAGLSKSVILSTSPREPITHWKQTFFPMQESIGLKKDDVVYYILKVIPYRDNLFWQWQIRIVRGGTEVATFDQTNLNVTKEELVIGREDFKPALTQESEIYCRVFSLCNGRRTMGEIAKMIRAEYPAKYRTVKDARSKITSILWGKVRLPEH